METKAVAAADSKPGRLAALRDSPSCRKTQVAAMQAIASVMDNLHHFRWTATCNSHVKQR